MAVGIRAVYGAVAVAAQRRGDAAVPRTVRRARRCHIVRCGVVRRCHVARRVCLSLDAVVAYADAATLGRYFEEGGESASIEEIMFEDLDGYMAANGGQVLDVRFSSEFDAGNVPGAVNASYTRMPDYAQDRVPRDKKLLVHCVSGGRSAAASSYLAKEGFDVVYVNGLFEEYAATHNLLEQDPVTA